MNCRKRPGLPERRSPHHSSGFSEVVEEPNGTHETSPDRGSRGQTDEESCGHQKGVDLKGVMSVEIYWFSDSWPYKMTMMMMIRNIV